MIEKKQRDQWRYTFTASDESTWMYSPERYAGELVWWRLDTAAQVRSANPCRTPADYRAAAECVERWEQDHAPRMRRRAVKGPNEYYWARHETLGGFVCAFAPERVRLYARTRGVCDATTATDANLAFFRDFGPFDEEAPDGE